MKPKNIKILQRRGKDLQAHVLNAHTIIVSSTTGSTANHVVTVEYEPDGVIRARCTCAWAINGGVACSHVIAAMEELAAIKGRALSFWDERSDAERQKRRLFYLTGGRRHEGQGVWITSRRAA
jgi:uncharacterized Zn finger protein